MTADEASRASRLPPPSLFKRSIGLAETLAIATAGGVAFMLIGVPAGLISGSMVAVSLAGLMGRPTQMPNMLRTAMFIVLGIAIGATVTPEQLRGIASYPASIVLLLGATAAVTYFTALYLKAVHGWDWLSATLASSPGALSQSLLIAAERGADLPGVVVVQSVRAILQAAALAPIIVWLGLAPPVHGIGASVQAAPLDMAILVLASTLGAFALHKLKFPGGLLFGAMIASATLHGLDLIHGSVPQLVRSAAIVLIGVMIGDRMGSVPFRALLNYLGAALGAFVVAMGVAALFMYAAIAGLSGPIAGTILAYVPGALDTMMVLALAMSLDPVFVGAHHIARFFALSLAIPIVIRGFFGPNTNTGGDGI